MNIQRYLVILISLVIIIIIILILRNVYSEYFNNLIIEDWEHDETHGAYLDYFNNPEDKTFIYSKYNDKWNWQPIYGAKYKFLRTDNPTNQKFDKCIISTWLLTSDNDLNKYVNNCTKMVAFNHINGLDKNKHNISIIDIVGNEHVVLTYPGITYMEKIRLTLPYNIILIGDQRSNVEKNLLKINNIQDFNIICISRIKNNNIKKFNKLNICFLYDIPSEDMFNLCKKAAYIGILTEYVKRLSGAIHLAYSSGTRILTTNHIIDKFKLKTPIIVKNNMILPSMIDAKDVFEERDRLILERNDILDKYLK